MSADRFWAVEHSYILENRNIMNLNLRKMAFLLLLKKAEYLVFKSQTGHISSSFKGL